MCAELSVHEQGTYVVQKAVNFCNAHELVALCEPLLRKLTALTAHPRGIFVIAHAMQEFIKKENIRALPEAGALLDRYCKVYHDSVRILQFATHALSGKVLVEGALRAALPMYHALKVRTAAAPVLACRLQ